MKKASGMTDGELIGAWDKGKVWMMTVKEDNKLWVEGLKRIEEIENEMNKRKIAPWEK